MARVPDVAVGVLPQSRNQLPIGISGDYSASRAMGAEIVDEALGGEPLDGAIVATASAAAAVELADRSHASVYRYSSEKDGTIYFVYDPSSDEERT